MGCSRAVGAEAWLKRLVGLRISRQLLHVVVEVGRWRWCWWWESLVRVVGDWLGVGKRLE